VHDRRILAQRYGRLEGARRILSGDDGRPGSPRWRFRWVRRRETGHVDDYVWSASLEYENGRFYAGTTFSDCRRRRDGISSVRRGAARFYVYVVVVVVVCGSCFERYQLSRLCAALFVFTRNLDKRPHHRPMKWGDTLAEPHWKRRRSRRTVQMAARVSPSLFPTFVRTTVPVVICLVRLNEVPPRPSDATFSTFTDIYVHRYLRFTNIYTACTLNVSEKVGLDWEVDVRCSRVSPRCSWVRGFDPCLLSYVFSRFSFITWNDYNWTRTIAGKHCLAIIY